MKSLLVAIVIAQILIIVSLLSSLTSGKPSTKNIKYGSSYRYIPTISEVVGSSKKYDVSGAWTAGTGTALVITRVDDNKFDVSLTKKGSAVPDEQLKANMDHYNGVLTVNNPITTGDPYYGEDYATPALILLLDPHMEDKMLDPYSSSIYTKVPANPASGNVISHLSGTWKDNSGSDILDITVTDYVIEGTIAENKIIGIFNPDNMKFVVFLRGLPIPGYYDNNIFIIFFLGEVYEFKKVMDYKP